AKRVTNISPTIVAATNAPTITPSRLTINQEITLWVGRIGLMLVPIGKLVAAREPLIKRWRRVGFACGPRGISEDRLLGRRATCGLGVVPGRSTDFGAGRVPLR